MLLSVLAKGYILGLSIAIPFGPINLEIVRRGMRHQALGGFMVGLGAVSVDTLYINLAGVGLAAALAYRAVAVGVSMLGGLVMGWIAWSALRDAARSWRAAGGADWREALGESRTRGAWGSYLLGLGMTASSPMTIAFWATVPASLFPGRVPSAVETATLSVGVFTGCLTWVCVLSTTLRATRRWIGPRAFAVASMAGGLIIAGFALKFLANGIMIATSP